MKNILISALFAATAICKPIINAPFVPSGQESLTLKAGDSITLDITVDGPTKVYLVQVFSETMAVPVSPTKEINASGAYPFQLPKDLDPAAKYALRADGPDGSFNFSTNFFVAGGEPKPSAKALPEPTASSTPTSSAKETPTSTASTEKETSTSTVNGKAKETLIPVNASASVFVFAPIVLFGTVAMGFFVTI